MAVPKLQSDPKNIENKKSYIYENIFPKIFFGKYFRKIFFENIFWDEHFLKSFNIFLFFEILKSKNWKLYFDQSRDHNGLDSDFPDTIVLCFKRYFRAFQLTCVLFPGGESGCHKLERPKGPRPPPDLPGRCLPHPSRPAWYKLELVFSRLLQNTMKSYYNGRSLYNYKGKIRFEVLGIWCSTLFSS